MHYAWFALVLFLPLTLLLSAALGFSTVLFGYSIATWIALHFTEWIIGETDVEE